MRNVSLTFGSLGGKPPDRFLIFRDGDVGIEGLDSVQLNAESAAGIIKLFDEHGSELVIDYHHMSGKVEKGEASKAPAAGWIRALEYVKGKGLFAAKVEWTDSAATSIEAGEFQYLSPSFVFDTENGDVQFLHSVALTNRPRTINAWKLVAAELTGEPEMAKKKIEKPKVVRVDAQEDVLPAVPAEMSALAKLIDKLGLPDDTSLEEVLLAALEALSDEPEAPTEEAPVEEESDLKGANAELVALRAEAVNAKVLKARLTKIEAELKVKRVGELLEGYIAKGVINPNNTEQLEAATALANSDETQFEAVYGSMPPVCKPGSVVGAAGGVTRTKKVSREAFIEKAEAAFHAEGTSNRLTDVDGWVNGSLIDAGLARLTDVESVALVN